MIGVYLDYNATAPIRPEALDAVRDALAIGGNPVVGPRRRAPSANGRRDRARRSCSAGRRYSRPASRSPAAGPRRAPWRSPAPSRAASAGSSSAPPSTTPSAPRPRRPARKSSCGRSMQTGVADLDWLADKHLSGSSTLVCLMSANNETGVVQPVDRGGDASSATPGAGSTSTPCSPRESMRSTSRRSARTPSRSRRTSSAGRKANRRSDRRPTRDAASPARTAAGRSGGCAPAPRTWPASPASARRRRSPLIGPTSVCLARRARRNPAGARRHRARRGRRPPPPDPVRRHTGLSGRAPGHGARSRRASWSAPARPAPPAR